jgi:hypothetical protein
MKRNRNSKARRLTDIMATAFGFIAIFIIVKGFIDMDKKIRSKKFFDRVLTTQQDTVHIGISGNTLILYPYSEMKREMQTGQWYLTQGGVWYDVKNGFNLATTGGMVKIKEGSGYVLSARYPEIYLQNGSLEFENRTLEGKHLYYKDYTKTIDTLGDIETDYPFILTEKNKETEKLQTFFDRTAVKNAFRFVEVK